MRIGSLFSGIGGLELGLERAGAGKTVWQVEIDPFCHRVLAKHWPEAKRFENVTQVGSRNLSPVEILCGGFPCQDLSSARNKDARLGLAGPKSGLWHEFARIIRELTPPWVVVENVESGKTRWLQEVREDLHMSGYDSCAFSISANQVGAPHERSRVFVIANPYQDGKPMLSKHAKAQVLSEVAFPSWNAYPGRIRMANGISAGLDRVRLRSLGNAVVPQCAEVIGKILLDLVNNQGIMRV